MKKSVQHIKISAFYLSDIYLYFFLSESSIRYFTGVIATERNLTQYFLRTWRQQARFIDKWGTQVARTAVALFLNDQSFFTSGNRTGEEIAQELSLKLLSKLIL